MRARAWAWWLILGAVAGARELDPAACAARFDVQHDKIIRTEESRDMGARYLSELDVGARTECLRLCCETDACDVFVYEEKGPGSCYLFNCGPPEDFRCKFTAHSNFSIGVLALSRRLAELQDQEQRAHREQQLASLRAVSTTVSTSTTSATPPPQPAPPPAPLATPVTYHAPPGRCSRYQFECRRGGECIAVYNACDGVPQCADGSDEAPELGCPPPPAVPTTSAPPPPPLPVQEAVPEHWPHRLAQAQPPRRYNSEGSGGSHIFSHKGGLLQEAESGGYAPFEPPAPWPHRAWPQQQSGMEGLGSWGGGSNGEYTRDWDEARRAWPVPPRPEPELPMYIPAKTMPEVAGPYTSGQATLRDSAKKGPSQRPSPAPAVAAHVPDLREEPRPAPIAPVNHDHANILAPNTDLHEHKVADASVSAARDHGSEASASERRAEAERHLGGDDHDGLSEHPPAAVLLLVLGVALTAALAATIVCRARAARRRLRRGKPFAHDADYLVNGMYL